MSALVEREDTSRRVPSTWTWHTGKLRPTTNARANRRFTCTIVVWIKANEACQHGCVKQNYLPVKDMVLKCYEQPRVAHCIRKATCRKPHAQHLKTHLVQTRQMLECRRP